MSNEKEVLNYKISSRRQSVIADARRLAERLTNLANKMEKYPDCWPNSLGELQSTATIFDAECAALCALVSVVELVK